MRLPAARPASRSPNGRATSYVQAGPGTFWRIAMRRWAAWKKLPNSWSGSWTWTAGINCPSSKKIPNGCNASVSGYRLRQAGQHEGISRMSEVRTPQWTEARSTLSKAFPQLYELEPGGPLALDLGHDGWLLEIKPEGKVICQYGVALDDVMSLMSDGTPEDLGTDEI